MRPVSEESVDKKPGSPGRDLLRRLETEGVPIINDTKAFEYETSKIVSSSCSQTWGATIRREGRSARHRSDRSRSRAPLPHPGEAKLGGSGAGIRSLADPAELEAASASGELENLGYDGFASVQEHRPAEGDNIVRVEILDGEYL